MGGESAVRLAAAVPEVGELCFIGGATQINEQEALRRSADHWGYNGVLRFSGYLNESDYLSALSELRVALQFRARSHGEMSAANNDLLAMGTPVISDQPSEPGSIADSGIVWDPTDPAAARQLQILLTDDLAWRTASRDARTLASRWTFEHLADRLLEHLRDNQTVALC